MTCKGGWGFVEVGGGLSLLSRALSETELDWFVYTVTQSPPWPSGSLRATTFIGTTRPHQDRAPLEMNSDGLSLLFYKK